MRTLRTGHLSSSHPDVAVACNASYFIDSLHLSPAGNQLMASTIARQFQATVR